MKNKNLSEVSQTPSQDNENVENNITFLKDKDLRTTNMSSFNKARGIQLEDDQLGLDGDMSIINSGYRPRTGKIVPNRQVTYQGRLIHNQTIENK